MIDPTDSRVISEAVLIVDGDVISRHAIAGYLRRCGYDVVEAAGTDEAMRALAEPALGIDVILCDVAAIGETSGFELAHWVHDTRPGLEVKRAASVESAATFATQLCKTGQHLHLPYERQVVIDYIRKLRAERDRG